MNDNEIRKSQVTEIPAREKGTLLRFPATEEKRNKGMSMQIGFKGKGVGGVSVV